MEEQNQGLFGRLRTLFSKGTVVRNIGDDNRLKTVDTSHQQTLGDSNDYKGISSSLKDLMEYGTGFQHNYKYLRPQIYADYELMDQDAIIASALDIMADESMLKNEWGQVLAISSENEEIKDILENLFYDILNIEFNLWSWTRMMLKYGDFFLHLNISNKLGIYDVVPISPYFCIRDDYYKNYDNDSERTVFKVTPYPIGSSVTSKDDDEILENYEMAHFRLLSDTMYVPYGRSILEPARRIYKQLTLIEDAMLLHRIMRAPEKRVFYIEVGGIDPKKVGEYMKKVKDNMKKVPYIDPQTGEYNLKYNIQNITEDFYIPVRGGQTGNKIETLKGLDYSGIEDVQYLRDKLFAALKVPKAFLGYEKDIEGKATLAAEDIRFARTVERIQKIILSELTKIAIIHLYVLGYDDEDLVDFELKLSSPSIIYEQEKITSLKMKTELAKDMLELNMFPQEYIYEKLFNISEEEYHEFRDIIIEDKKYKFRLEQAEEIGDDPKKTGMKYGELEDLKQILDIKNKREDIPNEYNEKKKDSKLGDDPLGKKRNNDKGENLFLTK